MKFYMYILIVLLCFCSLISVYGKTIFHLFLTVGEQTMQMNLWGFFLSQIYDDKFQRS